MRGGRKSRYKNYNTRRGEYGEAARKPRSARFPQSTRSPARGEPPQMAARATLWNSASRRAERMRHVRAADRRCTMGFRGIYPHAAHRHVRTPQDGFSCGHQVDRAKSRQRRRCPLSRSRRSAREGFFGYGGENAPPAPITAEFQYSVAEIWLIAKSGFMTQTAAYGSHPRWNSSSTRSRTLSMSTSAPEPGRFSSRS